MTYPPRPADPPDGRRWMIAVAPGCQALPADGVHGPAGTRKCTQGRIPPHQHNPCNAGAVALVDGQPRCGNHLGDRWLAGGIVLCWELNTNEGER